MRAPYEIEAIYRARIDYETTEDYGAKVLVIDKISRQATAWAEKYGVEIADDTGGPCWNAYMALEGPSKSKVVKVADMIVRLIRRYKGTKIYEV